MEQKQRLTARLLSARCEEQVPVGVGPPTECVVELELLGRGRARLMGVCMAPLHAARRWVTEPFTVSFALHAVLRPAGWPA